MTEQTKHTAQEVLKIIISIVGGGILTLLFTTLNETRNNTERIAKVEAVIEPLKSVQGDVAWLKATADRNVLALDRIEKKLDTHMVAGK